MKKRKHIGFNLKEMLMAFMFVQELRMIYCEIHVIKN